MRADDSRLMSHIRFINGTAILPDRLLLNAEVECRDGTILFVGKVRKRFAKDALVVDVRSGYIAPGFIDIHVHGGAGADFMDGTVEAVDTVCRAHATHGTTTLFPTTTTGASEQIMAMLQSCAVCASAAPRRRTRRGGASVWALLCRR